MANGKMAAAAGLAGVALVGVRELAVVPRIAADLAPTLRETGALYSGTRELSGVGTTASDLGSGATHYSDMVGGQYQQHFTSSFGTKPDFHFTDGQTASTFGRSPNPSHDPVLPAHPTLRGAIVDADPAYRAEKTKDELSKMIDTAAPEIATDLSLHRTTFTVEYATQLIQKDLVQAITARKDPAVTFEVATGKLKIDAAMTTVGLKVAFGEVNVYKLAAGAAVGVASCKGLGATKFDECVKAVLDKTFGEEFQFKQVNSLRDMAG